MAEYKNIRLELGEERADVVLCRQPYNILSLEMLYELESVFRQLGAYGSLKAVVLRSDCEVFSYGIDVNEHKGRQVKDVIALFCKMFERLWLINAVTISAVKGSAFGAGCELAVGCDLMVAADDAKFGQPEIKTGVFPPMAAVIFPKLVGRNRAFEWLFTGDAYTAEEAERIGLVNKVFPGAEFDRGLEEYVGKFTRFSSAVIAVAKQAIDKCMDKPARDGMTYVEVMYSNKLMRTVDAQEGLAAFLEKRPPQWKNM